MIKVTGDTMNPCAILDLAEWADLENAHGSAFPDTPARLRDLVSGDRSAVTSSLEHLDNALLNDGVVYSATAPAFRYVAALVGDRPSRAALAPPWEAGRFPLRGKLLAWLAYVAIHVSITQERIIREWANYPATTPFPHFIAIRNHYPEAFAGVASCFDDPDSRVVEAALIAAVRFSESPVLAAQRGKLAPLVEKVLAQSSDAGHRRFAHEALNAWRHGRTPSESYFDPTPSEEYVRVHPWEGDRGSFDEPPF